MRQSLDNLLAQIARESDEISAQIVSTIRAEVATYGDLPPDLHHEDVRQSVAAIIVGVREHRLPSPDAMDHAREMGRHRARFGLPVHDAITGYHIGYREIWNVMLARARQQQPDLTYDLAQEVTLLWEWFQRLSSAFSNAYDEERQSLLTSQLAAGQRLVRSLMDGATPREQRDDLLQILGFDPDGQFVVACAALRDDSDLVRLNEILGRSKGVAYSASSPRDTTVIVTQGLGSGEIVSAVHELFPQAALAIGLRRPGSAGAAASLVDALEGIGHAQRSGQTLIYESDWLLSLVTADEDRLRPILAVGVSIADEHPALAETVDVYLNSRQSITSCARALFLHPNSVKYRLQRWTELTGWDLHTVDGLVRSALVLKLGSPGLGGVST